MRPGRLHCSRPAPWACRPLELRSDISRNGPLARRQRFPWRTGQLWLARSHSCSVMRICASRLLGKHCAAQRVRTRITPPEASRQFTQASPEMRMDVSRSDRVSSAALAYRPDIDGLRGVAVILVVVYHAFPELHTGGFLGVDVFFVISGYLITQLILTGLHAGTFSVAEFYRRRVRRLAPALLAVLMACCIFGWLVLLPQELRWLGKTTAYSASFLTNKFFAWAVGDYFHKAAELNPLLHLWSLAVEEQFYLVWPALLILAARRHLTLQILLAVTATSLAISIWGSWNAPAQHFYYPGSRAWELAAGALLAVWQMKRPDGTGGALSVAGLALIVGGGVFWTADRAVPGFWSVIPVTGAVMIIAAGPHAPFNRAFLGSAPLVFVGKISYPLYLWHWPLLSFTRVITGRAPPPMLAAMQIAVAFLAAYATYRLLELPIRFGEPGRRAVPGLLAGLAVFTLVGVAAGAGDIPGRLSGPLFTEWAAAVTDWRYPKKTNLEPRSRFGTVIVPSHGERTTVFIGDSHIQQYLPRVKWVIETQPNTTRSAVFVTRLGCPAMPGINVTWRGWSCDRSFDYALQQAFRPDVDTVVFGAFWESYFLGEYPGEGSRAHPQAPLEIDSAEAQAAFEKLEEILAKLTSSGRRVFVVLSNPTSPLFEPAFPSWIRLSPHLPDSLPAGTGPQIDVGAFDTFIQPVTSRLRAIAARAGAQIVDPSTTLCDRKLCPAAGPDGIPLYLDSNHLRAFAARERASFVDQMLLGQDAPSVAPVSVGATELPLFKQ